MQVSRPHDLQIGDRVTFGSLGFMLLDSAVYWVTDVVTYVQEGAYYAEFMLADAKKNVVFMSLEDEKGETYLTFSHELTRSQVKKAFGKDFFTTALRAEKGHLLNATYIDKPFGDWLAGTYTKTISNQAGRFSEGDFRIKTARNWENFRYHLFLDSSEEYGIEVEDYGDGEIEVSLTVYGDLDAITDMTRGEIPPRGAMKAKSVGSAGDGGMQSARQMGGSILLVAFFIGINLFMEGIIGSSGGPDQKAMAATLVAQGTRQINALNDSLSNDRVPNAVKLRDYAQKLAAQDNKYLPIAREMASYTMPDNLKIKDFNARLETLRGSPVTDDTIERLNAVVVGTRPEVYNESYIDMINTLADLSGGALPHVALPDPSRMLKSNNIYQNGPGARLVGNEMFGEWRPDGAGGKEWAWYGMAATGLFYAGYRHAQWKASRPWSYYNDIGRGLYGTKTARALRSGYTMRENSGFMPSAFTTRARTECRNYSKDVVFQCAEQGYSRYFSTHRKRYYRSRGPRSGK